MSSRSALYSKRPFHHCLPDLPEMPAGRDPLAPVEVEQLQQLLTDALQDIDVTIGLLAPQERIFLEAWIRAYLLSYAPALESVEVGGEADELLIQLTDHGTPRQMAFRPGQARPGEPSEDDFLKIEPCDVVLLTCPVWTTLYAPLALAYLSAVLEQDGHDVEPVDLNVWMRRALTRLGRYDLAIMWRSQAFMTPYADESDWADEMMMLFGHKLDQLVNNILRSGARLVGLSLNQSSVEMGLRIAQRIKAADPEITVIAGGAAPTAACRFVERYGFRGGRDQPLGPFEPWRVAPEYMIRLLTTPDVDHYVVGEAELTLREIMRTLKEGGDIGSVPGVATMREGFFRFKPGQVLHNLDLLPMPSWRRLEPHRYGRPDHLPIWYSRGCINRCAYCTNNAWFARGVRVRGARHMLNEMWQMVEKYDVKTFGFTDLECNGDLDAIDELMDLKVAEKLDAKWHSYTVMRPDMQRPTVEKMVAGGNIRFEYGFESGCDRILKLMDKTYTSEDAARILRWSTEAGGFPCINLVVGFPGETEDDLDQTIRFLEDNAANIGQVASMNPYAMLPHARVLERAEELGIYVGHSNFDWRLADDSNDVVLRDNRCKKLAQAIDEYAIRHDSPYDLTITEETPLQSMSRRNLQDHFYPKTGFARNGPLRVEVDSGSLALTFDGAPLTSGLHLYTAAMFEEGPFVDSTRATWAVETDGRRLRAAGCWPNNALTQTWWINLLSDRALRLVVHTYVREPRLLIQRRQTHLMASGEYESWRAEGRDDGQTFEGALDQPFVEPGEPWQRVFFEPGIATLELPAQNGLPGLRVTSEDLRWDAHAGIISTDSGYSARVLQNLVIDPDRLDPVDFFWFKGVIEIEP